MNGTKQKAMLSFLFVLGVSKLNQPIHLRLFFLCEKECFLKTKSHLCHMMIAGNEN